MRPSNRFGGSLIRVFLAFALLFTGGAAVTVAHATGAPASTVAVAPDDPEKPGPFQVEKVAAPAGPGFAGGNLWIPRGGTGLFGGVAVSPGFTELEPAISWYGPHLASHGFVVVTMNTLSPFDQPDQRGDQLLAALDYVTKSSPAKDKVDAGRLAVMGHSMGGGGSLAAAVKQPALKAAVPLAPWHLNKAWGTVRTPTLIIGAEADAIAPVGQHAEPFYDSLPTTLPKAYQELRGADHMVTNSPNPWIARQATSWLKRFVDGNGEYSVFLCPPPQPDDKISEYRSTCPY
ncbi:dienelactone hydrolase [Herbihabitans rhizosphaerae]|uniref:Dienelactone hydrolase n=1 Tax=Herbihabitans rhizosphaerae TaxID=1872711 RepID=A0A4Q7KGM3_9PSEU|nr:alpha/beta hydrolase [Herbihabitans rhizosphaerae]RZS34008.1 dienelactone hydrolase [Herbihabitans rhizosphaerae]